MVSKIERSFLLANKFAQATELNVLLERGPLNENEAKQLKEDFLLAAKYVANAADRYDQNRYISILLDIIGKMPMIFLHEKNEALARGKRVDTAEL